MWAEFHKIEIESASDFFNVPGGGGGGMMSQPNGMNGRSAERMLVAASNNPNAELACALTKLEKRLQALEGKTNHAAGNFSVE